MNNKSRRLAAIGTVAAALTAGFVMTMPGGGGVLQQDLQLIRSEDNGPGPGDGDHNGQHGTGSRGSGGADDAVKPPENGRGGVAGSQASHDAAQCWNAETGETVPCVKP